MSHIAAMLAFKWARTLASCKNGDSTSPLVFGYASAAHHEFSKAKTPALARLVRQYFPHAGKLSSSVPTTLPSQVLAGYLETPTVHKSPPPFEHAESSSTLSTTAEDDSTASNATMDDSLTKMEHLDSLTFIRASLVLAQSGDQIAVKLMRILLQVRAFCSDSSLSTSDVRVSFRSSQGLHTELWPSSQQPRN